MPLQLAQVVASLVMDYEMKDRSMVEALLNKLHAARKQDYLVGLLKWCRYVLLIFFIIIKQNFQNFMILVKSESIVQLLRNNFLKTLFRVTIIKFSAEPSLHQVKNLPLLWAKVFDMSLNALGNHYFAFCLCLERYCPDSPYCLH